VPVFAELISNLAQFQTPALRFNLKFYTATVPAAASEKFELEMHRNYNLDINYSAPHTRKKIQIVLSSSRADLLNTHRLNKKQSPHMMHFLKLTARKIRNK
jgi:hypothetical protein